VSDFPKILNSGPDSGSVATSGKVQRVQAALLQPDLLWSMLSLISLISRYSGRIQEGCNRSP